MCIRDRDNDVKMIYLFIDRGRSSNAYIIGFDDEARPL